MSGRGWQRDRGPPLIPSLAASSARVYSFQSYVNSDLSLYIYKYNREKSWFQASLPLPRLLTAIWWLFSLFPSLLNSIAAMMYGYEIKHWIFTSLSFLVLTWKWRFFFFCLLFDYFCFCVLSFFLIYFWYLLTGNEQVKLWNINLYFCCCYKLEKC